MTTLSLDFIFFGHGKSAWCVHPAELDNFPESLKLVYSPGRFFAVNELKALMCYILMNFDVKTDDKVPPCMWFSSERFPNPSSKVSFKNERTLLERR